MRKSCLVWPQQRKYSQFITDSSALMHQLQVKMLGILSKSLFSLTVLLLENCSSVLRLLRQYQLNGKMCSNFFLVEQFFHFINRLDFRKKRKKSRKEHWRRKREERKKNKNKESVAMCWLVYLCHCGTFFNSWLIDSFFNKDCLEFVPFWCSAWPLLHNFQKAEIEKSLLKACDLGTCGSERQFYMKPMLLQTTSSSRLEREECWERA